MDNEMMRAGAYVVADKKAPDYEEEVAKQLYNMEKVIDSFCDVRIEKVYTDKDDGKRIIERSGFWDLVFDAEAGKIDCIIVDDLSRLTTNMVELYLLIKDVLTKFGIVLIFHRGNLVCTDYARDLDFAVYGFGRNGEEEDAGRY